MTTPKSPEQVVKEYEILLDKLYERKPPQAPDSEWLRSSMASLLCYMVERMPKHEEGYPDPYSEETDNSSDGFNRAIDDCRTFLIEEARKIAKDMILNEIQPSEERIRQAAKESAEDQNKMLEEARKITNNE